MDRFDPRERLLREKETEVRRREGKLRGSESRDAIRYTELWETCCVSCRRQSVGMKRLFNFESLCLIYKDTTIFFTRVFYFISSLETNKKTDSTKFMTS